MIVKTDSDYIELEQIGVILRIPKETFRLKLECEIIDDDGYMQKVSCTMTPSQIATARQDFIDNVEAGDDYDAVYELTDKALKAIDADE